MADITPMEVVDVRKEQMEKNLKIEEKEEEIMEEKRRIEEEKRKIEEKERKIKKEKRKFKKEKRKIKKEKRKIEKKERRFEEKERRFEKGLENAQTEEDKIYFRKMMIKVQGQLKEVQGQHKEVQGQLKEVQGQHKEVQGQLGKVQGQLEQIERRAADLQVEHIKLQDDARDKKRKRDDYLSDTDDVTSQFMSKTVRCHLVDTVMKYFVMEDVGESVRFMQDWLKGPLEEKLKFKGKISNFHDISRHISDVYTETDMDDHAFRDIDRVLLRYCLDMEPSISSEDAMHAPIDNLTDGLLKLLFSRHAVKRNIRSTISSSNYRPDEVVVHNGHEIVVQEEKYIKSYTKGSAKKDPVVDLETKAPWSEWERFFGALRCRPCIAVIGSETTLTFTFGLLSATSKKFEEVHVQVVDLSNRESLLAFFVTYSKFLYCIGAFATCLEKFKIFSPWRITKQDRIISSVVYEGKAVVRKTWALPSQDELTREYERMSRVIIALKEEVTPGYYWNDILSFTKGTSEHVLSALFWPCGDNRLPKDPGEVLFASKCIAEAVRELHKRGIVHNDIRWANIVKHNGRWILIDFDDAAVMNEMGKVPGCPRLTQQEHAPNIAKEHDAKVDIWSLAHLLTSCSVKLSVPITRGAQDIMDHFTSRSVDDFEQFVIDAVRAV